MVNQPIANHGLGIYLCGWIKYWAPLQGQMGIAKLKSAYNLLIIGPRCWDGKPTYRKSWAGNLLVWTDLTLGPSFKVKRG